MTSDDDSSASTTEPSLQDGPAVLGMHAQISFATPSLIKVDVTVRQGAQLDQSEKYTVKGASGNGATAPLQATGISGLRSYTAGQAFDIELTFAGTNGSTLSATIPAADVVVNDGPSTAVKSITLQDSSGNQSVSSFPVFQTNGIAVFQLALFGDSSITSESQEFTLKAGPAGDLARSNVTRLINEGSYTPGEDYLVEVTYRNDGQLVVFQGTAPGTAVGPNKPDYTVQLVRQT